MMSMQISFSKFTDKGGRDYNEDCLFADVRGESGIFLLCDGLGGHGAGDIASGLVCSVLPEGFFESTEPVECWIADRIRLANDALLSRQKELSMESGMKTTLTALLIKEGNAVIAHIGDSRVYRFSNGRITQRTIDHSVPQMMVLTGELKEKNIRHHEDRNRLTRVMGVEWENDRFTVSDGFPVGSGDAFLLTSDGFWEWIIEKDMERCVKKAHDADEWIYLMSEKVKKAGRKANMDNYSAIAVQLGE